MQSNEKLPTAFICVLKYQPFSIVYNLYGRMERPFSENVVHSTYNTGTLNILMDYYIHREILVLSYKLFDVLPHVGGVEWNCGNSVTSSKINNKFDNCKKIEAFRGASHSINSVCALV